MRELEWWAIGGQGLKIPFFQWPTLLACVASASAIAGLSLVTIVGAALWSPLPGSFPPDKLLPYLWPILAAIWFAVFQWCWMTALWHNTLKHCLTFPVQKAFWLFVAVFLLLMAVDLAFAGGRNLLKHVIANRAGSSAGQGGFALATLAAQAGLHVFLLARLMIWPAYTIARRELVSPIKIWHATSGLFWDFVFLQLRIQIPIAFIGFVLFAIAMFFLRSGTVVAAVAVTIGIYSSAALGAAMLLAYFEIIGKREPALLPAG